MKTLLKIEEVAVLIGSSVQTINNWYAFKRAQPDNEYAKMLPEYEQASVRQTRLWNKDDIQKFIEFKRAIPKGCKGTMGVITQRYVRKETKNVEKSSEGSDSRLF